MSSVERGDVPNRPSAHIKKSDKTEDNRSSKAKRQERRG